MEIRPFNFDRSVVVMDVVGHGTLTKNVGYDRLKIFSPGLRNPIDIELEKIQFQIHPDVEAHTHAPCYDPQTMVMAFPYEDKLVWCFCEWQIHLDLLPAELREKPKPETQAAQVFEELEDTLPMGA